LWPRLDLGCHRSRHRARTSPNGMHPRGNFPPASWILHCHPMGGTEAAQTTKPQDLTCGSYPAGRLATLNHFGLVLPSVSRRRWSHHSHAGKCQQHHSPSSPKRSGLRNRGGVAAAPQIYAEYASGPPHPYVKAGYQQRILAAYCVGSCLF
jgi:hypothetical protein